MSPARISLIISTYERPQALEKVLRGVAAQARPPDELLLADDGSTAPTREVIERWRARLPGPVHHLWHPDEGFRKTVILNKAVAAATGDYVVLLDGDCVPHPAFVADHHALAEANHWVQGRRCFIKEPYVDQFDPGDTSIWQWLLRGRISGVAKSLRLPFPVLRYDQHQRGIIGCNMGFWRADLVAVNGFDEAYTGWGIGEDSDLGTRLYHLGRWRKFVYAHAVVYHLNHPALPRDHFPASQQRLAETIRTNRVRCEQGLDQYLRGPHDPASPCIRA